MDEIIERIEEFEGKRDESESGFKVTTNQQIITLAIANGQCCCEDWGYFLSEDDPERFVGARLLNVTVTNTALKTVKVPEVYDGSVMFVNLETDRGTLQFVAYNAHNGYYGHDARVESRQITHEERL